MFLSKHDAAGGQPDGPAPRAMPFPVLPERRRAPRAPAAFAFWIRGEDDRLVSAWMLNVSDGGAAFLTPAAEAPHPAERVGLVEMQTRDRFVRECAGTLPPYARVLRVDEPGGVTCRVAVRFEADAAAPHHKAAALELAASARPDGAPPHSPPVFAADGRWVRMRMPSTVS